MEFQQADINHFNRSKGENPHFWSSFSEKPDLKGATVLDIGSGRGSLCVDMALAGARKVIGLDITPGVVDFANRYLKQNYPELSPSVEFKCLDLRYYGDRAAFDYIVSKNAFEHIIELDRMLCEMEKRLKPGGRVYTGFGPLYPSPFGDHNRRQTSLRPWGFWGRLLAKLPWGHLFIESTIITMSKRQGKNVNSMYDLGLNKMSVSDYRKVFLGSGLSIIDFRVNQSTKVQSKILSLLRHISFLEDYCTHNIYCILEKPI